MEREEEITVIQRSFVNPFSCDVLEEFSPMDESGSFRDSCGDFCGDTCGLTVSDWPGEISRGHAGAHGQI